MRPIWERYEKKYRGDLSAFWAMLGCAVVFVLLSVFHNIAWLIGAILCGLLSMLFLQAYGKVQFNRLRRDVALFRKEEKIFDPGHKKRITALLMMASPCYFVLAVSSAMLLLATLGMNVVALWFMTSFSALIYSCVTFVSWIDGWEELHGKAKHFWGIHALVYAGILLTVLIVFIVLVCLGVVKGIF
ncbi:MAG: hypothetical protein IJW92_05080 [Clostridia bacterium]|nr:hypothetical protein [Clostridia bacterium]